MKRKQGRRDTATGRRPQASGQDPRARVWPRRLIAAGTLVLIVLGAAAAWFYLARPAVPTFVRTANQNVLLVTIDTLRADALGCYGGRARTPNLDRLSSLGIRFDFAHAHAVVTLPSHVSILTGTYPADHGVHDNAGFRVPAAVPTLASRLKARNMPTAAFIGSFALDSRFGLNQGFDVYDEHYGKSNIASGFTMPERRADAVVAAANSWIGKQSQPWFAWVHVFDPHAPYDPPPPFDRQYADAPYAGEVAFTDSALGPLLDAARDPSGRPTLVIVTGDHGEGLGDHGELTHGLFAYESTLRIPLILAQVSHDIPAWGAVGQASPPAGAVSATPVRHVDIVATVLDALGLPTPDGLPGRSLLPDRTRQDTAPRASYFEALSPMYNRGWAPLKGVLLERDKFIDLPLPELYNLARDPGEQSNLVGKEAERQRTLEARLRAFGTGGTTDRQREDAAARARLQALGYVSGSAPVKERYTEADDPKRLVGVDAELRRAVELYERKQAAAAIAALQQVIAERPTMEVAYSQLAMIQWEAGRPADAVATLRASLNAGCDSVIVKTRLGTYLAETGNVQEAIPLLQVAVADDEADSDALNALGIALARAGRSEEARAAFERILAAEPGNSMALENLGSIALGGGRMADARRFFASALQADPDSTQANNGMGVVELKAGNRAAAIERFSRAVRRDPENFDALYNLATELANDGRVAEAKPYLEQFVRTAPPAFYAGDIQRVRALLGRLGRQPR
jgi:arylsulfatase A-like enzyme/tetratricopeptide (TPR) repeat protein